MKPAMRGVREAAEVGRQVLAANGIALDAVQAAVELMEDNQIFNAGTGSSLNLLGKVEADAGIMDGATLMAGGVALVSNIRNPIRLARLVMEKSDHALLAGPGADSLATTFRLEKRNLVTSARKSIWLKGKKALMKGSLTDFPKLRALLDRLPELKNDTVGALALDEDSNLAAASSTGGYSLKLPGRIGDSPLIGAGFHADNESGCATVTGRGEGAMRLVLSKSVVDLIPRLGPQRAAERGVRLVNSRVAVPMGVIALDRRGRIGAAQNTSAMPWASFSTKTGKFVVRPRAVLVEK